MKGKNVEIFFNKISLTGPYALLCRSLLSFMRVRLSNFPHFARSRNPALLVIKPLRRRLRRPRRIACRSAA